MFNRDRCLRLLEPLFEFDDHLLREKLPHEQGHRRQHEQPLCRIDLLRTTHIHLREGLLFVPAIVCLS